jgi:hypothetical protein
MMKQTSIIYILILLLLSSCQKNIEAPYTLKFYGDAREDIGYSVAIAPDGYIIAGQMEIMTRESDYIVDSLSNKQMAVIKTGWDGNVIWKVIAGGKNADMGAKVYQLSDGSVICVGTYSDTISNVSLNMKKEVFAVKISPAGSVIWEKTYGGPGNQTGKDIAESTTGFFILGTTDVLNAPVTDSTGNPSGKTDIYILSISATGDYLDSYQRGFPGNETAAAIKKDINGNYIVLGTTDRSENGSGQAGNNLFILQLNSIGQVIGKRIYGTADDEYSSDVEVLQDGYLVAGTIGNSSTTQQGYLVRLKRDIFVAPEFWWKYSVNNYSTSFNSVTTDNNGNFLIGGYVNINPGLRMLVAAIGANGNLLDGMTMIKGSTGDQIINDVVSGDDGYIIGVGRNTYEVNSMISLLKFRF